MPIPRLTCIACRMSEQRVHGLLEGMCEAVAKKSNLYTTSWTEGTGSRMWSSSASRDPSVPANGTWTEPPRAEKDGGQLHVPQTDRGVSRAQPRDFSWARVLDRNGWALHAAYCWLWRKINEIYRHASLRGPSKKQCGAMLEVKPGTPVSEHGGGAGRQKELENYCVRLLDEHEDALIDVLKGEAGDLDDILCVQYTRACTGAAAAAAAADAADKSEL